MKHNIKLYNEDNLKVMETLPDESIDVICIDPPYLYLKNQKLERVFDEYKFFRECKRLLTIKGFIVMFGRGTSFYRWNTILDDLGFVFKEEIVWDKRYVSSPVTPISRKHETVSIYSKKNGIINNCKVDYIDQKEFDLSSLINDVKRIKSALNNKRDFSSMLNFLETGNARTEDKLRTLGNAATVRTGMKQQPQSVKTLQAIVNGMKEKSIIQVKRDHYKTTHPTQKPVRLIERLLALVIPLDKAKEDIVVADFFAGSMSCMEAVYNMGMQGIATEIEEEYFNLGKERIESLKPKQLKIDL